MAEAKKKNTAGRKAKATGNKTQAVNKKIKAADSKVKAAPRKVKANKKDEQTSKSLNVQLLICINLAAREADKKDRLSSAKDALTIAKMLNRRLLAAERKLAAIKKQVD